MSWLDAAYEEKVARERRAREARKEERRKLQERRQYIRTLDPMIRANLAQAHSPNCSCRTGTICINDGIDCAAHLSKAIKHVDITFSIVSRFRSSPHRSIVFAGATSPSPLKQ